MKVKDLKDALSSLPDDMEIILQKDSEGNGFSPLAGADSDCVYQAECGWGGTVYDVDWSADDCCMEEEEWQEILNKPRCLVLFPIN